MYKQLWRGKSMGALQSLKKPSIIGPKQEQIIM
jgi:hypothetical protein